MLLWRGGTPMIVSPGAGNWQTARPEPGLTPARGSQVTDRRGSRRGSQSAPPPAAPYRALGTSTGPRPPPGPARASPPYLSSMPAQEPPLPAPRALLISRRRSGSAGAGASLPHVSGATSPAVPAASPGSAGRHTRAGRD